MEITFYILSVIICSTIASRVESEQNDESGMDLKVENINFEDLNSRILDQDLDRSSDDVEAENKPDSSIKLQEQIDFGKSQAQGPAVDAEPMLQPFPGLNQDMIEPDLSGGYSQFEDEREDIADNDEDPNQSNYNPYFQDSFISDWSDARPPGYLPENDEYINTVPENFPGLGDYIEPDRKEVEKETQKPKPKSKGTAKKQNPKQ